jgi:hypothetical protein
MQDTRLTTLVRGTLARFTSFTTNPWRRISLVIISFLLGNFLGTAIITTAGQIAAWDLIAAFLLVVFTELISRLVYRRSLARVSAPESDRTALLPEILNALKIGITYSLFIEAFKLGS